MKQVLVMIAVVALVGCGKKEGEIRMFVPDPDAPGNNNNPFIDAVDKGDIEAVKKHLADGADVNAGNPLNVAIELRSTGRKEIEELLLAKGSNVNAKNNRGWTPAESLKRTAGAMMVVDVTAEEKAANNEIAALLLQHGAKTDADFKLWFPTLNKPTGDGEESNNTPVKPAKKKVENPEANRALIAASRNGDLEAVQDALGGGVNVNASGDGRPPLYFAVWADYTEIAKLLIAKGAEVNQKELTGFIPLYSAVGGSAGKETIELLIANGANIDVIRKRGGSRGGETPLDRAIRKGRTQTANLLRKHWAKTNKELEAEDK